MFRNFGNRVAAIVLAIFAAIGTIRLRRFNLRPWIMVAMFLPLYWIHFAPTVASAVPSTIPGYFFKGLLTLAVCAVGILLGLIVKGSRRWSHGLEWVVASATMFSILWLWGGLSFHKAVIDDVVVYNPTVTTSPQVVESTKPVHVVEGTNPLRFNIGSVSPATLYAITGEDDASLIAYVCFTAVDRNIGGAIDTELNALRAYKASVARPSDDQIHAEKVRLLALKGIGLKTDGSMVMPRNNPKLPGQIKQVLETLKS